MLSRLSHVQLFVTLWTIAHQATLSLGSPGKNTGVGCHAILQGTFPTQTALVQISLSQFTDYVTWKSIPLPLWASLHWQKGANVSMFPIRLFFFFFEVGFFEDLINICVEKG